eukprot:253736-Chlamydomonas_euryale.AAC.1
MPTPGMPDPAPPPHLVCARIIGGKYFALNAARAEATRHQNAIRSTDLQNTSMYATNIQAQGRSKREYIGDLVSSVHPTKNTSRDAIKHKRVGDHITSINHDIYDQNTSAKTIKMQNRRKHMQH